MKFEPAANRLESAEKDEMQHYDGGKLSPAWLKSFTGEERRSENASERLKCCVIGGSS